MSDYSKKGIRFVDLGLDLRDVVDVVDEGHYLLLENVRSANEGSLIAREGRTVFLAVGASGSVHTLKRIDESTLFVGAGTNIYRGTTPYAQTYGAHSGDPLSTVVFKPAVSASTWLYLGDSLSGRMRKVKADGTNFKWGITRPSSPATFSASGSGGNLDSSVAGAVVYDWRFTYYSTLTGAESNPSDVVTGISVIAQSAFVGVTASIDTQVDQIRVYRRGGTNGSQWRLAVTGSNATATLVDNNADSTIALATPLSTSNDVPFTTVDFSGNVLYETPLSHVWGPFSGKYIFATGDANRPGYVYWTNAGNPDGASSINNVQVTGPNEPLQNGCIYSSLPFVFSKDQQYTLDFGQGTNTFTPRKTPCGKGLVAPWALDGSGPFIAFLSSDGIYGTDGQSPAFSLTEDSLRPMFLGEATTNVNYSLPEDMRLRWIGQKLYFTFRDQNGTFHELVWHSTYKRWKTASGALFNMTTVYEDENQQQLRVLYGGSDGNVYSDAIPPTGIDGTATGISVAARTGFMTLGEVNTLKEFGNLVLDCDPDGGSITVTPIINSGLSSLTPTVVTGASHARFPISLSDTYAYNIAFNFAWSTSTGVQPILYSADLLWRLEEEAIKHWEFPETSHTFTGWQHLRMCYIALRSTSNATLTITVDGTAYTYTIPSTSGQRRKQRVDLRGVKGKMFRYAIDSTTDFRLYGEDCEVEVKPWVTSKGYQLLSPFRKVG